MSPLRDKVTEDLHRQLKNLLYIQFQLGALSITSNVNLPA